MKDSTAS